MKSVIVFDTAIGTSNLGDEIIYECLQDEMAFLLDNSFVIRWGTHVKNLDNNRCLFGSQKLDFADRADFKLIMGTNMLSRNIKKTQAQWPMKGRDSWLYENSILAGVGTTLSVGQPTNYSRRVYNKILRKDVYHSVRDEESKRMLENMGFKALNTGCPTLWKFTPEFCKTIPTKKSDNVIFSLSGYKAQQDKEKDQYLIDILKRNYKELIFWCQTTQDEIYLDKFEGVEDIKRIYSLRNYAEILDNGNVDYVGTRLHGGVFAMQHGVRSIIISIDHRARGFHETNNLVICERKDIMYTLEEMINSEFSTEIVLQQKEIDEYKAQFMKEYPNTVRRVHSELLLVKILTKSKKIIKKAIKTTIRAPRKIKKKLKKYIGKFKRRFVTSIYSRVMRRCPIVPGQSMFFTFQGLYTCNPKYISEEIIRRNLGWKQVWVTMKKPELVKEGFPQDVVLVKFGSREYYKELAKSQFLIDNAFNFVKGVLVKKKEQIYFETMHGSLGIKRIGPDVVDDEERNARGYKCGDVTDVCISNSTFENFVYEDSFWKKDTIKMLGHARNDIFFCTESEAEAIKSKVYEFFGISKSIKLALYAPTFRIPKKIDTYERIDFEILKRSLESRFGGEWIILNRAHRSSVRIPSKLEYVLDAEEYPDIQELMIAIDFAITDYSSWIFDYVLTRKLGMLYIPDLEDYSENRGFYYPITESPYPLCTDNSNMYSIIEEIDEAEQRKDIEAFLERRGCMDDGHASERIVDFMVSCS